MKPYALTENRPLRINADQSDALQHDSDKEDEQEISYPRDLSKQGLLVSLAVSVVVVGLLVFGIV